jgi:hypothetical protein
MTAPGHGIDAVADEIGNQLPQLARYSDNLRVLPDPRLEIDLLIANPRREYRCQQPQTLFRFNQSEHVAWQDFVNAGAPGRNRVNNAATPMDW